MEKQFEATPISLYQIDRGCVMGFSCFFSNLFSCLFIFFSIIITWFEITLSIWISGDIKAWYFTRDQSITPPLLLFQFWPQGHYMNNLGRDPLGDARFQISKLCTFLFQRKKISKFSFFVPMFRPCDSQGGANFDPRGIIWIILVEVH